MTGNWDKLYEHYVHLGTQKKSRDEVVADLKLRLKPIKRSNKVINVIKKDDLSKDLDE